MGSNGYLPSSGLDMSDISARIWGGVAAEANIAAIISSNRADKQLLVDLAALRMWVYDAASSASPSAGSVVKPDDVLLANPGRWVALTASVGAAYKVQTIVGDKVATDGSAGAAIAEHATFRASSACTVTAAYFVPDASLTAHDTDNATLTMQRRDTNGINNVTVASATTSTGGTGNWTAFKAVSLGTITNAALAVGETLTVKGTKAGSGVAVPAGAWIAVVSIT